MLVLLLGADAPAPAPPPAWLLLLLQVTDPQELHALQVQVNEFGQTPRQLFTCPHPPRTVLPPAPDPEQLLAELQQAEAPARSSSPGPGGAAAAGAAGSSSSSSGLVNAGEDGGGGSVAMSLLHTLVAALEAAPCQPPASTATTSSSTHVGSSALMPPPASSSSSSSSRGVPIPGSRGAGAEGGGRLGASSGLSLSPPDDADVMAARPLTLPLPAAPRAPTAARGGGGVLASLSASGGTQALLGLLQRVTLQPATPQRQQQAQEPDPGTPAGGGGAQGARPDVSSPTAALTAAAAASGGVGAAEASWPDGAARRLLLTHSVKLQRQPLSGVAACPHSGQAAVVGQDGLLRILQLPGAGVSR
jgi:hypothetical protein